VAAAIAFIASKKHGGGITVDQLHDLVCRNKKTIRETSRVIENELLDNSYR
jgi:hypothetical protein